MAAQRKHLQVIVHHSEFGFSREIQTTLEQNQAYIHAIIVPFLMSPVSLYLESSPKHLNHYSRNSFNAHAKLCLPFSLSLQ